MLNRARERVFRSTGQLILSPLQACFSVLKTVIGKYISFWGLLFAQTRLLFQLSFRLLETLGFHAKWMWMTVRLVMFVQLLSPVFLHILYIYITSKNVVKNVSYGKNARNLLDIYKPNGSTFVSSQDKKPVVLFVCGGAWIIGYKGWGALLGLVLRKCGMVVVTPDYRNYPQGNIEDMLLDISTSIKWTFDNIHRYGGDRNNVFIIGQSAGGQLVLTTLFRQAIREERGDQVDWSSSSIRSFIGISSPYNLESLVDHLSERGLSKTILLEVFQNHVERYSPFHILTSDEFSQNTARFLPPATLLHGGEDITCPASSSLELHHQFQHLGVPSHYIEYPNKSHTDPIIEDPLCGDDPLIFDVITVINGEKAPKRTSAAIRRLSHELHERQVPTFALPKFVIRFASWINPF